MFSHRVPLTLHWVAVMDHSRYDRAIRPAGWDTRCISAGQVHEFINVGPGPQFPVDHVEYFGFAAFEVSGVLAVGDALIGDDGVLGRIVGFDETHMPNHYNILVECKELLNGRALSLIAGESIATRPREDDEGDRSA